MKISRAAFGIVSALGTLALAHCGSDESATPDGGAQTRDGGAAIDAWTLPDTGTPIEAGDPGPVDITFEIHADQAVHPISPYVYGVNDPAKAAEVHATIARNGGNRMTAFNWETNASNAGMDYQYQNDDFLCANSKCLPNDDAPGAYLKSFVDTAVGAGASVVLTVPIVDYVSADKGPGGDVRGSGGNYLMTRFKQNKPAKGSAFGSAPDPSDAFVYQDEMVHWIQSAAPSAQIFYLLDNEPDLWASTHAEIHPKGVTYEELRKRSIDYATAVKAAAPNAQILGFVSYGWNGYTNLQNASDANGDFIEYFLDAMKAAEQAAGKRLVDVLDLHWYPEARGGGTRITEEDASPAVVAAREAAPRSLWDKTYPEDSWIVKDDLKAPIALLPRMRDKIAQHYPGTKLSLSEWNYGAGGHISGAIASADVLGVLGREGADMAMMWPLRSDESFTYAAFRAFRSYDGNGKAFGDTSIAASTSDIDASSVYASVASSDPSRVVIIAINKSTSDRTAGITLGHSVVYATANVYTVTAAGGPKVVAAAPIAAVATNAFRYTMPAQSISVLEPGR